MNSQKAVLRLENISVSYKSGEEALHILKDADFSLYKGEIVALVAPDRKSVV